MNQTELGTGEFILPLLWFQWLPSSNTMSSCTFPVPIREFVASFPILT